jgi:hypothetical protein
MWMVRFLVHREVARLDHALAGARVGLALLAHQVRHQLLMAVVDRVWSSAWPLMISGVRASSIRIESTSSTMA